MATLATLENNGERKQIPLGFSVLTFFFQFFVPLFRKDFKNAVIFLIIGVIASALSPFTTGISLILCSVVLGLKYNQIYAKSLLENGWKPATEADKQTLISNGVNL